MNLTVEQVQWIVDNILIVIPVSLFIFTSLVIGFWKLIGKLFSKKHTPQAKEEVSSSGESLGRFKVSDKLPQAPVEANLKEEKQFDDDMNPKSTLHDADEYKQIEVLADKELAKEVKKIVNNINKTEEKKHE